MEGEHGQEDAMACWMDALGQPPPSTHSGGPARALNQERSALVQLSAITFWSWGDVDNNCFGSIVVF